MDNLIQISSRLLLGVKIGDSWLSYDIDRSVLWLEAMLNSL